MNAYGFVYDFECGISCDCIWFFYDSECGFAYNYECGHVYDYDCGHLYLGTSKLIYISSDNLKIDINPKENL